jgi:DNA invertase Pin-like site-specific DNA recombinase
MEKKIQDLMKNLGCDYETAKQVVLDDERIDKGEKLFEQTAEQKANSKKYRQGDRKPTVYKLDKRERKADEDKRKLVELIASAVGMITETEPTVTNVERQIDFEFNGRKFRVVLSAPRT